MSEDVRIAQALGELSGRLAGLAHSIDQLRTEAATRDGALQAQITEVANQQRGAMTTSAQMGERLDNHLRVDENNHAVIIQEIGLVKADVSTTKTRLEDLFTWRGKILGGLAVVAIVFTFLGHFISWVGVIWGALFHR